MRASVADFYQRVPSRSGVWTAERCPTGSEKELYAKFAHILLSTDETIPALLKLCDTKKLGSRVLDGKWCAYRVSTVRRDKGMRGKEIKSPLIFPGGSGRKGITDVVLLLNPVFGEDSEQIQADLLLYFELKSRDHYRHHLDQLDAHLDAISLVKNAFLIAIGGKPVYIKHRRWLGHVTLGGFFEVMSQVAKKLHKRRLADEIEHLCKLT